MAYDTTTPMIARDQVTQLLWEVSAPGNEIEYAGVNGAEGYCQQQTINNVTGWRIPTRMELVSLLDFTANNPPTLDTAVFPSTPLAAFWTSTPYEPTPGSMWTVSFIDGRLGPVAMTSTAVTRCVHDPIQDAGAPPCVRYQVTTTTAMDTATGLTWQLHANSAMTDFSQAGTNCAALGATWRLPTIQELLTLVDDLRSSPALEPAVFGGQPSGVYWSSTPSASASMQGQWYVDFGTGMSGAVLGTNMAYARCVQP